jgi:spore coat polysaccharide biosynthesis predicted glycosyltransferase SpsG
MKIAFRVDYGNQIGMGHFTRMSALAEAFSERGCDCLFFRNEDEPIDYSEFDIVIIDTYLVDDNYISSLNSHRRLLVCYDDNALYRYNCDVLINANLYANELNFSFGSKIPKLLLGGKYALLREEFRNSEPLDVRKDANRIFICFGGTDLRNSTPKVVSALQNIVGIELTVVLGAMTNCDREVESLSSSNVRILKTPKLISEVMRECDIAITAAGSMTYELASIGLPSLSIIQADNQKKIAEYMNRNGLIKCVGNWKNINIELLCNESNALLSDYSRRLAQSNSLYKTVDKKGVNNIVNTLFRYGKMKLADGI